MAAVLIVLIYIVASTAFAKQFPFAVLQDLSNSNSKRRIVYDAVEAAALIPFAAVYVHVASFGRGRWIPWAAIGVCAALVAILLPERLYAFLFYFIVVGCGEEFVFRVCPWILPLYDPERNDHGHTQRIWRRHCRSAVVLGNIRKKRLHRLADPGSYLFGFRGISDIIPITQYLSVTT